MQIDSHPHGTSQSLRCLLYDCFSKQQSLFMLGNGAIIKEQEHKKAILYFLSQDFSHIAKIVNINGYLRLNCIKYCFSKDLCMVAYPQEKYICLQTIDNHTKQQKQAKLYSQFKAGEYFLAFSQIFKMKYYDLLIGYTSLRQFYLITIKNGKELEIFKLRKKEKFFNLLSWLSLEIVNQFKDCFIHVYKVDESENFILMLCIRDNNATLFLLQLFPETHNTTIKQVGICEPLQKIIPASAKLVQVLVITKDPNVKNLQCILSYQLKDGYFLFIALTVNFKKANIFDVSVILEGVPAPTSLAYIHVHLIYYTFDKDSNQYKCFKRRGIFSHERKTHDSKEFQMFLTLKEKPYFMSFEDQLFIATVSQVHQIQVQPLLSSQQSDLSQLQQHLAQFKNQINLTYRRQIHKLCKKNPIPIEQITYLLTQKYHKIIEWIKNQFSQTYHEQQSYLILTLQIISTLSAKFLLLVVSPQEIIQRLKMKSVQIELKDFYAVISGNEIAPIINLINNLAEHFPIIVNQMLNKIENEKAMIDTCFQAIKTVYSQAYQKMFQLKSVICTSNFQQQDLIRTMVGLDLGNTVIYESLITQNPILFKESILQYKTLPLFIDYFFQIDFIEQEVKSLVEYIHANKRQHFRKFIGQLLLRFRKQFKKGRPLIKKIGLLISGFMEYPLQITSQMKKNYPGLLFFYYLRVGQKKQGVQFIKNLLQDPNEQYSHLLNQTIMKAYGSQFLTGSIACQIDHSKQNKTDQNNTDFQQILRIGCEEDSSSENCEHSNKKIKLQ